jgi:glycosyltransferase involved in cell wall biosynthesis
MIPYRVAIAVSGLGHIRRGSETWAVDLANALHRRGIETHLFGAGPVPTVAPQSVLRAVGRNSIWIRWLDARRRYLIEQKSFTRSLLRALRSHPFPIVHLTDPQVAWWARDHFRNHPCRVAYMDGLMLGPDWNWRFDHVQVVAPEYRDAAARAGHDVSRWSVIPHFVDPALFNPPADRRELRDRLLPGVSLETPVALAVGDFSEGSSKRLDYVVSEIARLPKADQPWLILAGNATTAEKRRMEALTASLLGPRVTILTSLARENMPALYAAADFFIHAALREPFGIVLLEAMASGCPVAGHSFPVTRWIIGDGGISTDLSKEGALAAAVTPWIRNPDESRRLGTLARGRVRQHFSPDAVLPLYAELYAGMMASIPRL